MIRKQHKEYFVQQEEWQYTLLTHLDNMEMLIRAALRARNEGEQALAHCYAQMWKAERDAYSSMAQQKRTPTYQPGK